MVEQDDRENDAPRRHGKAAKDLKSSGGEAGNAIHDPENQTRRLDMPEDEQTTAGEPMRGSAPPTTRDRSNQPKRPDHRSNQDRGRAPGGKNRDAK